MNNGSVNTTFGHYSLLAEIYCSFCLQESGKVPPPSEDLLDMVGGGMPVRDCLLSVRALEAIGDFTSFWQLKGDSGAASVLFCWFL